MKSIAGWALLAIVLAIAGAVSWTLGRSTRDLANLRQEVATLQFAPASDRAGELDQRTWYFGLPDPRTPSRAETRRDLATSNYWLGRYDRLSRGGSQNGQASAADGQEMLLASNAAYRATQMETVDRPAMLQHLEGVIKAYGEVLKADPDSVDAAYNYEFVVRTRNTLTRPPAPGAKLAAAEATPQPPSMHGRVGAPPKSVNMATFRVIIPKRSEERQENPEASKGGAKTRKG